MAEYSFSEKCVLLLAILNWCTCQESCKTCFVRNQCREGDEPRYYAEQCGLAIGMLLKQNSRLRRIVAEVAPEKLEESGEDVGKEFSL